MNVLFVAEALKEVNKIKCQIALRTNYKICDGVRGAALTHLLHKLTDTLHHSLCYTMHNRIVEMMEGVGMELQCIVRFVAIDGLLFFLTWCPIDLNTKKGNKKTKIKLILKYWP